MTSLAFLCTGDNSGWNPICNGDQLLALVIVGVVVGLALTFGAKSVAPEMRPLGLSLVWLVATTCCVATSLFVGVTWGA